MPFAAFIAIGHTASAIGSDIKPFLESIMSHIKTGLQNRGRKNTISEEPIFQCIGMLAAAVGPHLTKLLHDQLDLMFAAGLSEPLCQALSAIVHSISPLLSTIQGTIISRVQDHCLNNARQTPGSAFYVIKWTAIQASGSSFQPDKERGIDVQQRVDGAGCGGSLSNRIHIELLIGSCERKES